MQPDEVHDFVHQESGPGHVPGILENGDAEKQDQNVRQKDNHAAHAGDDAVQNEILEKRLRKNTVHS